MDNQRGMSTMALVLTIAVGCVVIGGAGWYVYHTATSSDTVSNETVNLNANDDAYQGWEVYSNLALGLSMKMPPDWKGYSIETLDTGLKFVHPKTNTVSFTVVRETTARQNVSPLGVKGGRYYYLDQSSGQVADGYQTAWDEIAKIRTSVVIASDDSTNSNVNAAANSNANTNSNTNGNTNSSVNATSNSNVNGTVNASPNANTNASVNTNATSDVTKGWKTYANVQIGYAFKYPSDWSVKQTSDPNNETLGKPVEYVTVTTSDGLYSLIVGVKRMSDTFAISDRTGAPAGDFESDGTTLIAGIDVSVSALMYNGMMKEWYAAKNGPGQSTVGTHLVDATLTVNGASLYKSNDFTGSATLSTAKTILSTLTFTK